MKKVLSLLVVLVLVVVLAGCGSKSEDLSSYAGTYEGKYTRFVGDSEDAKNEEEFTLVLEKDGKGTHYRDGLEISVTWKVKSGEVQMTEKFMGMTIDYTGTLEGNSLVLYNGDPEDIFTA